MYIYFIYLKVPLMKDMSSVKMVKQLYIQSLVELLEFEKKVITADQEEQFSLLVEGIYERHSHVLVQMAKGAYEFRHHIHQQKTKNNNKKNGMSSSRSRNSNSDRDTNKDYDSKRAKFAKMEKTHEFLDRFYLCRIGIRVLIGQYLALRQPPVDNYVGRF